MHLTHNKSEELEEPLLRHMIINVLRSIAVKFKGEYGPPIIVSDSYKYWRKEIFPYYKASRKKNREKSDLDWPILFKSMNTIKKELKDNFPYKYIEVDGAEADDVIATICKNYTNDKIMIVSGDKDYSQLHTSQIKQYDPIRKRFIECDNIKETLFEHIIRGDVSDGIPNIVSDANVFVIGARQRKVTKKIFESVKNIANEPNHELYNNYMRNLVLIDFDMIPKDIQKDILNMYSSYQITVDKSSLMMYLAKHGLKNLLEQLQDF